MLHFNKFTKAALKDRIQPDYDWQLKVTAAVEFLCEIFNELTTHEKVEHSGN